MALNITFSEPATVGTSGQLLAAGSVYDSGHGNWVYLGFRSPLNVASVQTSPDRTTWTMHNMPSASTWRAIAYAPTLAAAGRLVAVGNGVAAYSDDGGVTWNAAVSLPEANNWIDVQWWAAKSIFVMVAGGGTHRVGTSADGKSWTMQNAASALVWSGLAVSGTTAVAVAFSSSLATQLVMTSTDGVTWTLQTHASVKTNRGIVSSGSRLGIGYSPSLGQFLITATDGSNITSAWRSTDSGVTWTASNAIPVISSTTNRGYVWLPAANSWYMPTANFDYGESIDGINWTVTAMSTTNSGYTPMAWLDTTNILLGGSTLGFDDVLVGVVSIPHSLTSIVPNAGTVAGGTKVTITGVGFANGITSSVTFDGLPATSLVTVNDTTLTCVTPVHHSGAVDVVVSGQGASGVPWSVTGSKFYTYQLAQALLPPIPLSPVTLSGRPEDRLSRDYVDWLTKVKQRIEAAGTVAAEQIVGVLDPSQIPQLPDTRLTVAHTPRLIGRTTTGSGPSEEISVAPGLALANDVLSLAGLLSGFTIGDLLYAISATQLARLADVATGSVLVSGGVATAPAWSNSPTVTNLTINGGQADLGVTPNKSFVVAPSGGDFTTIQAALDHVQGYLLSAKATITITVNDGTYTMTSPLNISHYRSQWFTIQGQNTYSHNVTSVQSTSGASGAWTFILNLDSVANMAAGDYVTILAPSGGTNPTSLAGCFPVTNVDAINTRITITSKLHSSAAPSGAVTGALTVLKTVLKFNGCDGFQVWTKSGLVLDKLAVVGDSSASHNGLSVQDVSRLFIPTVVGVSAFGANNVLGLYSSEINGVAIASSDAGGNGFDIEDGATLVITTGVASGCASNGFLASEHGFIKIFGGSSNGNSSNGFFAQNSGSIRPSPSTANNNANSGYSVNDQGSYIDPGSIGGTGNGILFTYQLNFTNIGQSGRVKSFGYGTSSPFDQQIYQSNGSTGGWQGCHDFQVSYNGGGLSLAFRVQANTDGTTDVQFGHALVALGGGAAPTLGTIGGSGPATTAQNSWMRFLDSTGAAFWVPVWK